MSGSGILKDVLCPSSTVVKSRHNKKYLLNVTSRNPGIKFTPSIDMPRKKPGRFAHFAHLNLSKCLQQPSIWDQFSATKPHAETLKFFALDFKLVLLLQALRVFFAEMLGLDT